MSNNAGDRFSYFLLSFFLFFFFRGRGYLQLYTDEIFWILIGCCLTGNGLLQEVDCNHKMVDTKEIVWF